MICLNARDKGKGKKNFSNFRTTFSQIGISKRSITNIYSAHTFPAVYLRNVSWDVFNVKKDSCPYEPKIMFST